MSTTFVTSIYSQLSDGSVGRWERYTLSLKSISNCGAYFVIYTSPEEYDAVKTFVSTSFVDSGKVEIRSRPISSNMWNEKFSMMKSAGYKSGGRSMDLVHSKIEWLNEVAIENPFSTTHFFWIDAGLSFEGLFPKKFLRSNDHLTFEKYTDFSIFNPEWLDRLENRTDDKMYMIAMSNVVMLWNDPLDKRFYTNDNYRKFHVIGGLFGSKGPDNISQFRNNCVSVLNEVLSNYPTDRLLPVEELIYTIVVSNEMNKFDLNVFDTWYHEDHEPYFDPYKRGTSFHQLFI